MRNKLAIGLIALLALTSAVSAAEWKIDGAHSNVQFKVTHMVISTVTGKFDNFSGTVWYDGNLSDNDSVHFTVEAASIDTDNEKRDEHLRSDEFLGAEEYPEITFRSTKLVPGDGSAFTLIGDLTIRDVTKEVAFECVEKGQVDDPWGNTRAGFSAKTTIDRKDYNVNWSNTLDNGGLVVSDDVELILDLELVKQK